MIAIIVVTLVLASCSTEPAPIDQSLAAAPSSPQSVGTTTPVLMTSAATLTPPPATATPPPSPSPSPSPSPTETPSPTLEPTPTETPIPPTATPEPEPEPELVEPTQQAAVEQEDQTQGADVILNGDPAWPAAIETTDGARMGVVTSPELNIRAAPDLDAEIIKTTFARHTVSVYELVTNADGQWYRIGEGRYVSAAYVAPFSAPAPEKTYEGRWIDVNLSSFYAIAYDGDTPVYSAIITAGRGDRTPVGVFNIFYRVRSEIMDSATVGIPKGDPEYYYLENVEYTQYFLDGGYAVHGNYWTDPSDFGQFSSNGCVGLMNPDAAWFWDFLSEGSVVSIHY